MALGHLAADRDASVMVAPELRSGVSWAAIIAGAVGAAALSLILLILGVGLGLSSMSPWADQGATIGTMGTASIVWICFTQLAAAGMGGYLAGRLRGRFHATHGDEVYFRDTAHGFLAWAVATLLTAALLTTVIGSILGTGAKGVVAVAGVAGAGAGAAGAAAMPTMNAASQAGGAGQRYFVDSLFRRDSAAASAPATNDNETPSAESGRIFATALSAGALPPEDVKYLGQTVAQRTGLSQADAEKRVTDTFSRMQDKAKQTEAAARDAADKARKASAYSSLWLFVSLLVGAFCASLAATYGGRRRDLF